MTSTLKVRENVLAFGNHCARVSVKCGLQIILEVFAEFNRVTSRNLEADFFEALDEHTPCFIQLFKSKKGSVGQKLTELMQSINWVTPDVTEQRSVVLKGIAIVLGNDSNDFFKTCFDTTRDEALSSVTVGVLTVLSEDSPQEGPSSMQLEPISISIVLEGGIVMEEIQNFPQAVCLLFGLIYALHFDYPKCMANTLRFVQTVMLGLGTKTLSPKLLTVRNALLE
ncbi:hypothetical protein JOQ06_013522 [Pogonophryne albipinna]|uniref:Uncharacterized protein n=1 Tax=Pogonophryne albipinna TaxID=1090488 RepID=A0AAD6BHT9_9TELE|nr:hypothetical protein JOQ06_013522 [Pogonophryne albipinna]